MRRHGVIEINKLHWRPPQNMPFISRERCRSPSPREHDRALSHVAFSSSTSYYRLPAVRHFYYRHLKLAGGRMVSYFTERHTKQSQHKSSPRSWCSLKPIVCWRSAGVSVKMMPGDFAYTIKEANITIFRPGYRFSQSMRFIKMKATTCRGRLTRRLSVTPFITRAGLAVATHIIDAAGHFMSIVKLASSPLLSADM